MEKKESIAGRWPIISMCLQEGLIIPVLALVIPLFFPSQRQMGMGATLYKI